MTQVRREFPALPLLMFGGAALYAAYMLRQALLPFLLSFALAYILTPMIDAMETRGIRRFHIVLGFYLGAALFLYLLVQYLLPIVSLEISRLQANSPAYMAKAQHIASDLQVRAAKRIPHTGLPLEQLIGRALASASEQLQYLPSYLLGLFPLLSLFFLVPFITFFLLLDGPDIISAGIQACPSRYVEQAIHLISEIDASLGNYLRGILIVALAITGASYLGLLIMDVNSALAIALLSGVSSFVPYLGAIMGAVVGGTAAFMQFGKVTAGLKVVLLFFGIRLADEAFLQPFIAKYSVHLHPLMFLLALIVGGEMFGFMGLVFAIPAACVIKALLKVVWEWYLSQSRMKGHAPRACVSVPYT
ncbi:MAG: AI-2E family transporter [Elusimicrobiota bacterium]|jgi:predicted PurR-regulated permease PerM